MYQVFSSLLGHLHFSVHFSFTFMEQLFKNHPVCILVLPQKRWKFVEILRKRLYPHPFNFELSTHWPGKTMHVDTAYFTQEKHLLLAWSTNIHTTNSPLSKYFFLMIVINRSSGKYIKRLQNWNEAALSVIHQNRCILHISYLWFIWMMMMMMMIVMMTFQVGKKRNWSNHEEGTLALTLHINQKDYFAEGLKVSKKPEDSNA